VLAVQQHGSGSTWEERARSAWDWINNTIFAGLFPSATEQGRAESDVATRTIAKRIASYWEQFEDYADGARDSLRKKADLLNQVTGGTTSVKTYAPAFLALPVSLTVGSELQGVFNQFMAAQTRLFAYALEQAMWENAPDWQAFLRGYCSHYEDPEFCYTRPGERDLQSGLLKRTGIVAGAAAAFFLGPEALALARSTGAISRVIEIARAGWRWGLSQGGRAAEQAARLKKIADLPLVGNIASLARGVAPLAREEAGRQTRAWATRLGLLYVVKEILSRGGATKIWNTALAGTFFLAYLAFVMVAIGLAVIFGVLLPASGIFRGSAEVIRFGMAVAGFASIPIFTTLAFWVLISIRDVYVAHVIPLISTVASEGTFVLVLITEVALHLGLILVLCGYIFRLGFRAYALLAKNIVEAPSLRFSMPLAKS